MNRLTAEAAEGEVRRHDPCNDPQLSCFVRPSGNLTVMANSVAQRAAAPHGHCGVAAEFHLHRGGDADCTNIHGTFSDRANMHAARTNIHCTYRVVIIGSCLYSAEKAQTSNIVRCRPALQGPHPLLAGGLHPPGLGLL